MYLSCKTVVLIKRLNNFFQFIYHSICITAPSIIFYPISGVNAHLRVTVILNYFLDRFSQVIGSNFSTVAPKINLFPKFINKITVRRNHYRGVKVHCFHNG